MPNTEAYLKKYIDINVDDTLYPAQLRECSSANEFLRTVSLILNESISDFSDYGRELPLIQKRFLEELADLVTKGLEIGDCITTNVPNREEVSKLVQERFRDRVNDSILKKIVHSVFSAIGLYETPHKDDLPDSLFEINVDGKDAARKIFELIDYMDIVVEKHTSTQEKKREEKQIPINVLEVMQSALGSLQAKTSDQSLKKIASRIENLLGLYGISVDWVSEEDSGDELNLKYDVVVDDAIDSIVVTRPCFLKKNVVHLRGELVSPISN